MNFVSVARAVLFAVIAFMVTGCYIPANALEVIPAPGYTTHVSPAKMKYGQKHHWDDATGASCTVMRSPFQADTVTITAGKQADITSAMIETCKAAVAESDWEPFTIAGMYPVLRIHEAVTSAAACSITHRIWLPTSFQIRVTVKVTDTEIAECFKRAIKSPNKARTTMPSVRKVQL